MAISHKSFDEQTFRRNGFALLKARRFQEAEDIFQTLVDQSPGGAAGFVGLAKVAQQRQLWEAALEHWDFCLARFPNQVTGDWLRSKGNVLINMGRLDEARLVFRTLSERYPEESSGFVGLARVAQHQQSWKEALAYWNFCIAKFPSQITSDCLKLKGRALLKMGRLNEAESIFHKFTRTHPREPYGFEMQAFLFQLKQDWAKALCLWEEVGARFPERSGAYVQQGQILKKMGRLDAAENRLLRAVDRWPDSPGLLYALAEVARAGHDYKLSGKRWKIAMKRFPDDYRACRGYILSYISLNACDEAYDLYVQFADEFQEPAFHLVLVDIYLMRMDWDAALKSIRDIAASAPDNLTVRIREALTLKVLFRAKAAPERLEEALALMEKLQQSFPFSLRVQTSLAKMYIAAQKNAKACQLIDNLPKDYQTHNDVMQLIAWRHHFNGDDKSAQQICSNMLQRHFYPAIHDTDGQLAQLSRMDRRSLNIRPGEILLFTVLRNELPRLERFFRHYRRLGVNRFFVVDNGSEDGSLDFLLAQDDVHVFFSRADFRKANSGMLWINHLIEQYGEDHWCLYVDLDELLIFPESEQVGLSYLTRYMESYDQEALFTLLIDMYARDLKTQFACPPGSGSLEKYKYFNTDYHFFGDILCPYTYVAGGIRKLFANPHLQTKVSLIYAREGLRFITTHHITPAVVSDVTAAVLHYKMMGASSESASAIIEKQQRIPSSNARHLQYVQTERQLGEDFVYLNAFTERFTSSRKLIEQGLLRCPEAFSQFIQDEIMPH